MLSQLQVKFAIRIMEGLQIKQSFFSESAQTENFQNFCTAVFCGTFFYLHLLPPDFQPIRIRLSPNGVSPKGG